MPLRMHKIQVWTGEIPDRAGAAAAQLELLARAGADLEFVFTRPIANQPDKVAIFLAPIQGNEQLEAARLAGLAPARDIAMVCVEGENRSGIGYEIMSRLAIAGINLLRRQRAFRCLPGLRSCRRRHAGNSSPGRPRWMTSIQWMPHSPSLSPVASGKRGPPRPDVRLAPCSRLAKYRGRRFLPGTGLDRPRCVP